MSAIREVMRRFMPASRSGAPARSDERKVVLGDYYSALSAAGLYSPYRSRSWPVERAVAEAYERVVWIFKAVEAIASTASRLPFELKKGESKLEDHPLCRVLNKKANPLETGQQFRKRLSAQILLSKRGAFVEVTRSNGGDIIRMDLLPPGRTVPIPGNGDELIDHYEIQRRDGTIKDIPTENVRWFRDPHPLDPFCGVTPLEAAGMSVEMDFFARMYNVAFLRNDSRPGGVLAVDGVMGDEEMNRVENRFAKGAPNAGSLAVIQGQVSYVDLATRPRDMQHETTSTISKKEILSAFGVPESVIGDASGRSWDNAEQELYNFWTITMPVHLSLLTTGLDEDSEDDLVGCFDTSGVEVLQRAAIARRAEARDEFDKGLISMNEYRDLAGYEELPVRQGRSLFLPSGRTEVPASDADAGALEKEAQKKALQQASAVPAAARPSGQAPEKPASTPEEGADGSSGAGRPKRPPVREKEPEERAKDQENKRHLMALPGGGARGGARGGGYARPTIRLIRPVEVKALARESEPDGDVHDRLEVALGAALAALMVRLAARTATRLSSPKARKHTRHWEPQGETDTRLGNKALDIGQAVDVARWSSETEQAARPLVEQAAADAARTLAGDLTGEHKQADPAAEAVRGVVDAVVRMLSSSAASQAEKLADELAQAEQNQEPMADLVGKVRAYAGPLASWAKAVAAHAATATVNGAREAAASVVADVNPNMEIERIWRTRGDTKVRLSHKDAAGQTRALGHPFLVGGAQLRYPGDEEGPPDLTYGCRCRVIYRATETGRFAAAPEGEITRNPFLLAATGTEGKDAVNGRHVPGTPYNWRHGWEPLNAHMARQHGKPWSGAPRVPKVNVLDPQAHYINPPTAWQKSSAPEERAATIWSDSYGGLDAIRTAIRNRQSGKDPLQGVDVASDPWLRSYTQVTLYNEDMTRPYSEEDLKADVVAAADVITTKMAEAPHHEGDLWRGMMVADPDLFQVGQEFEQDISSWTGEEWMAREYATPRAFPGKPLDPSLRHPVLMRVRGQRAYNISDHIVGNTQGGNEFLASGRYRVTEVTQDGSHIRVSVETI